MTCEDILGLGGPEDPVIFSLPPCVKEEDELQ